MERRELVAHTLRGALVALVAATATASSASAAGPDAAAWLLNPERGAVEVRSTPSADVGILRPSQLAYVRNGRSLLVGGAAGSRVGRAALAGDARGSLRLPGLRGATLAVEQARGTVALVRRSGIFTIGSFSASGRFRPALPVKLAALALRHPQAATFDRRSRSWLILDDEARTIVRVPARGGQSARIALGSRAGARPRGIAVNPADGLIYVASADRDQMVGVDRRGQVRRRVSTQALELADVQGIAFAPSADPTDDRRIAHLYVADAGSPGLRGAIVESQLAAPSAFAATTAPNIIGNLVQVIQTSSFGPPAPDPAGVTYIPESDRLIVTDSEVEEMRNYYQGVNTWSSTRSGAGSPIGTTVKFSKEPTGLGYRSTDATLLVSDDDADRVTLLKAGADGRFLTADDVEAGRINTLAFGSTDSEDVDWDPTSGDVFICDGSGLEVYRVRPTNAVFGDADDVVTHFDIGVYGARDCEGMGVDAQHDTVLAVDPSTKKLYELTMSGTLVSTVDISQIGVTNKVLSDVVLAPTSNPDDSPTKMNYWVSDRQVDNGFDPNENDGKVYEISIPGSDAPPSVAFTAPAAGVTVSGSVAVSATASDDVGVTRVAFSVDGIPLGTDTDGSDGWSATWDSTVIGDGPHVLRAAATDTVNQTTAVTRTVSVDNMDSLPSISITDPAASTTVSDSVSIAASASDDVGVATVAFAVDGAPVATDTDGTNGWSAAWNSATVGDGAHTISATATDTNGQTATASRDVTVDNTPPAVAVTAPAAGASVSGTVTVTAAASDSQSLASVEFRADGAAIGTDTSPAGGWSVPWATTTVTNGSHTLRAVARDGVGHETTSAPIAVTVSNSQSTSALDAPIRVGADDADELAGGAVTRSGGDIELGSDHGTPTTVGLRFANLAIPPGSTITNATVQFQVDETDKDPASLTIAAHAADNAGAFTSANFDISSRPRTTGPVSWSPPTWLTTGAAGADQRTPDLKSIVQQVVGRPGWASGNALVIVITGSGRRTAEAFEGGAPPRLHVEYDAPIVQSVAPHNTTAPSISGLAKQGQQLSASSGTWTGTQPIGYAHQWRRCDTSGAGCTDITGATSPTYTVDSADIGATLRVQVTAGNVAGSETATSAPTDVVQAELVDGLSEVANSLAGSSEPTYYGNNHRVAVTAGGRMLALHGRHATGIQLAWRDPGGSWSTTTQGAVTDGMLLSGTNTGDWTASIALARDASGNQRAWVVWSSAATGGSTKSMQIRRLSSLDAAGGPSVGPAVLVDTPDQSPARADIAVERLPDGSRRLCIAWVRHNTPSDYALAVAWITNLETDTPAVTDRTTLLTAVSATRNPTLATSAGGVSVVARSATDKLQRFLHDPSAPLSSWTASALGVSTASLSTPSAITLSSGPVLAAVESNTTSRVVTVQRFGTGGAATIDLQLTGYAMPTLATDGENAWLVMIRQSDGNVVSRSYSPTGGWNATDRVEVGAEGGGNYSWPNALRETDGRLRFIVRGPSGALNQNSVLAFQRPL